MTYFSLLFLLLLIHPTKPANFGRDFLGTRSLLRAYRDEYPGRKSYPRCHTRARVSSHHGDSDRQIVEENSFLNMVNYLEYIKTSKLSARSPVDAIRYLNVSTAAFDYGNTIVAQENMARALVSMENFVEYYHKRSGAGSAIHKREAPAMQHRMYADVWDPEDLFSEFRRTMGDTKFEELLHLDKKVAMAFVIDTSSSMENDMFHVREYIQQILVEQDKSGVPAVYIVTTYADPFVGPTKVFKSSSSLMKYLNSLNVRIGGDCEEKTCSGIMKAMNNAHFNRKGNAAMYVFTDAGSKDCRMQVSTIARGLQWTKASAYFIMFDSCTPNIDANYVQIARRTGGFCLLVRDNAVYNITDTVHGAFESDALICGDDSTESNSVVGQGVGSYVRSRRKIEPDHEGIVKRSVEDNESNGAHVTKQLLIDDLVDRFKVTVEITPPELVTEVQLIRPADGHPIYCMDSNLLIGNSVADNAVIFDVESRTCPCVGNWTLSYPSHATTISFAAKSIGDYALQFESYFVDDMRDGLRVANMAPCLGIEEYLVIKLNQGEQIETTSLTAKILATAGNVVHWEDSLLLYENYPNTYIVGLVIPEDMGTAGFRILLEGIVKEGVAFQRLSSTTFYPTASCLRLQPPSNYHAIFPRQRTFFKAELTNYNQYGELYSLSCSNTENYPVQVTGPMIYSPGTYRGFPARSNPVYLRPRDKAQFTVSISAPRNARLVRGRTVTVNCVAATGTDELIDSVRLTEMEERFYD